MGVSFKYGGGSGASVGGGGGAGGGLQIDLLWTNSDTTVNFAAQDVSVDLSNYRFFAILPLFRKTAVEEMHLQVFPVDENEKDFRIYQYSSNRGGGRKMNYSTANKTISFSAGYYNGSADNQYAIPYKIYGIK